MDNCIMAEQCNKNSSATSSSAAKWWSDVQASSICSWTSGGANYASNASCNNSQKRNSNCSNIGEEDVSISTSFTTNASNNSGLSMESSRQLVEKASTNDPYGEAVSDNHHLWNQVLLDVGTTGELQNIPTRMFEPAYDYLKKLETGWEFSGQTNINQFQKNFNGFKDGMYQSKIIPSTANSWSIAPQEHEISTPQFDQYIGQFTTIKNEQQDRNIQCEGLFRRRSNSHAIDNYEGGIHQRDFGDNNKFYYNGISDMVCTNGRGFVDLVAFGGGVNKPSLESNMPNKSMINTINILQDRRKPDLLNTYQPIRPRGSSTPLTKISGRVNGVVNEGKKKKSEDQGGSLLKKTKLETSTVSSTKVQIPKAKLGDKITALQQIVSPFGKTDTASVLWEAIGYIKCLQEQVQLLSNPYLKTNIIKDSWARFDTKDRGDTTLDLKSRGLCLVPVSCTPQVYHENSGSDYYWTPTYRGCFYR